jgi:N,N'-diacetyllegionaminate synthase
MRAEIAGRAIGAGAPMFVIAELGLNHGGAVQQALRLVDGASTARAHAIKLQVFEASRLVAGDAPGPSHLRDRSLRALFRDLELDLDACAAVITHARTLGLAVLATAFDEGMVAALDRLDVDAFKIASGDLTHVALIEAAARTRRPLVVSTGMSSEAEVAAAVDWAAGAGARTVALLPCVSAYSTPVEQQNLAAIRTLSQRFGLPVGLSDHGMGREAALLTHALGGTLYERHLWLPGTEAIDQAVSSTPDELGAIVEALERAQAALGHGRREPMPAEQANLGPSRRGLYAARHLPTGTVLAATDIVALRPATSLGAEQQRALIGCRLARDVTAGDAFTEADLEGGRTGKEADRGVA